MSLVQIVVQMKILKKKRLKRKQKKPNRPKKGKIIRNPLGEFKMLYNKY